MINMDSIKHGEWTQVLVIKHGEWTQVLVKGKQLLFYLRHPPSN
jgi:hypothetical protein